MDASPAFELVDRGAQSAARKRIGTVVKGKWKLEELLGTGGMAHVFAARHRNGRRVAIKFMRDELMLEPSLVERFLREGYIANKIEHPGAVAILDDDITEDGAPFLVMELLVGRTLRQRLARGPLALSDTLNVITGVLDVLSAAHEKGIVHRDLKPDNLFETDQGEVKVLDFGIARLRERSQQWSFDTGVGTTMGTVGYMPPEQARGLVAEVDARSDVWAMAATMYMLLTGRPVHEAATPNEALLLAMTAHVAPMASLVPWLPSELQSVLDRALAFEKRSRFSTALEMKIALEAASSRASSVRWAASARASVAPDESRSDRSPSDPSPSNSSPSNSSPSAGSPLGARPRADSSDRFDARSSDEVVAARATPTMLARVFSRRGVFSASFDPRPPPSVLRRFVTIVGPMALVSGVIGAVLGANPPVRAQRPRSVSEAPSARQVAPPTSGSPTGAPIPSAISSPTTSRADRSGERVAAERGHSRAQPLAISIGMAGAAQLLTRQRYDYEVSCPSYEYTRRAIAK